MPEIKLVYQQIKEYIQQELKGKNPGEAISSEVQYSQLFKVSRPTVRKAVEELVQSGVVRRIPGKGLVAASREDSMQKGALLFAIPYIPADGFFFNMISGCIDMANKSGMNYKIINQYSSQEKLDTFINLELSSYKAVVLTAYENTWDEKILDFLHTAKLPFVLVDNPISCYECPFVVTDDYKGGYLSGEFLVNKGHKKILYVTMRSKIQTAIKRENGFRQALQDKNIILPEDNFLYLNNDDEITGVLSALNKDYTAICGYSDLPMIKAYNYLTEHGVKIPGQVSLIGYGNFIYSELLPVPLTTIAMPVYEMGSKATEMAIDILNGRSMGEQKVLGVELIERNSVISLK